MLSWGVDSRQWQIISNRCHWSRPSYIGVSVSAGTGTVLYNWIGERSLRKLSRPDSFCKGAVAIQVEATVQYACVLLVVKEKAIFISDLSESGLALKRCEDAVLSNRTLKLMVRCSVSLFTSQTCRVSMFRPPSFIHSNAMKARLCTRQRKIK